ncbi:MAG: adenylate/guanylate cyclase domain-containing protein [Cyanobacteria bacterium P01_G01_bin.54]
MNKQQPIAIPIGIKIFGIAVSLLGLLLLVAYNSHQRLRQLQKEVADLAEYIIPITNRVDEVDTQALEQEVHLERILKLYETEPLDLERIAHEKQQFEDRSQQVDVEIAAAIDLSHEAVTQAAIQADREELSRIEPQLTQIEQEHQDFYDHAVELLQRLAAGERGEQIYALELQIEAEEDHLNEDIEAISDELGSYTIRMVKLSESHQAEVLRNSILITVGAVGLGLAYASGLTFSIVRPLRHLTNQVQRLQEGKAISTLAVKSNDEVGLLNATFNHLLGELEHKEKLKALFGKYVDPRVVEQHEQQGKALQTTGEKQIVTVLMSDMDGFQEIAQTLAPEQLVAVINRYLSLLSATVSEQHGFIEFVDTVIKGFWAPPFVSETAHAQAACEAALNQVAKLPQLRKLIQQVTNTTATVDEIDLHIGLATGPLILANMGPEWATVYSVLGDTVNTAARLKGAAKQFGIQILMLEETQQQVQETMVTREIGLVQVVGKDDKLRVFELLGRQGELSTEQMEWKMTFAQGLTAYRQQAWAEATSKFASCAQLRDQDKPTQHYLHSIQTVQEQTLPADWDGVWTLTKKA